MQPIPRIALVHEILFESLMSRNADGDGTYATAQQIFFVRCNAVAAWIRNSNGEMKDDKLTLFYDCVNSLPMVVVPGVDPDPDTIIEGDPLSIVFKQGDRVTFMGDIYSVREVKKDSLPHHYEVILK
jgi:hypothetical protein